ncbi:hypothetical protein GCK72_026154 [Caenorhabditis remanei]|uniref:MRG domain-containing protein n=1 Tax=Caenorhabditis remanei TaxID=31234 RepID=A0A6A5G425_CAERE|nr:hypothetical protein GCK72_026154 [Caenorhabditis remanei]KAF1749686.1 hypothetical protein GCK72_026154 [Caenorhabditis remanei]
MEPLFEVGEVFVCLFEKQHPYEAKMIGMREERGVDHYVIHYIGWHKRHNEIIPFGEEEGKMFKGNLKQFAEEHPEIEIPADAHKGAKRGRAPNPKNLEGETSIEKKDEGGEEEEVEKKNDEEEVEDRVEDGVEEVVGPVENVVEEEKVEKKKDEEVEERVVDTVKDVGGPEEEVEVVEQVEKKPEKKAEKLKSKKKEKANVVVNDQPPSVFPKSPVCLDALEPPLSNTLRDILVEDLDYVNKYFVTRLPVGVSVEDIMVEYKKHLQATKKRQLKQLRNPDIEKKKKEIIAETDKLLATANGIVPIFNAALGLLKTGIVYSKGCEETEKSCIAIISNGGCLMDLDLPEWKPQIKLHRFPKTRWHEEKNEIKRTDVVTSRGSTRNTPHYQPGGMGKNILNFSEYF